MADFDSWAIYYDLIHKGLDGEAEFYIGQALKRGGDILEVGCGTGRIALPMALSGLQVVGIDNSEPMLEICRDKMDLLGPISGALRLANRDMRDFSLRRRFPLILMTYRTFMHCLTTADQLACLGCIFKHLERGGELLFNVWAAHPSLLAKFPSVCMENSYQLVGTTRIPDEDVALIHLHHAWRDDFRQLLHERHWIQEQDLQGRLLREEHLTMTRAWFSPREMEHLVVRAGFEIVSVLGAFDGDPLGPEHTEMIWHLRRP